MVTFAEIHNNYVDLSALPRELDITAKRIQGMFWISKYTGISGGERESVAVTLPGIALFWSTVQGGLMPYYMWFCAVIVTPLQCW